MKSILVLLLLLSGVAEAKYLPRLLTIGEQEEVLKILGFGSAAKVIGAPYPLGGYEGVELSVASEFIPMTSIQSSGGLRGDADVLRYTTINLGKGIFYDIDTYVFCTILQEYAPLGVFGGQLRWGFYRSEEKPFTASVVFHGSSGNFENQLYTTTLGLSLYGIYSLPYVKIYGGFGQTRSIGTFAAGDLTSTTEPPVTNDGSRNNVERFSFQTTGGVTFDYQKYFLALEWNRFVEASYAVKFGSHF